MRVRRADESSMKLIVRTSVALAATVLAALVPAPSAEAAVVSGSVADGRDTERTRHLDGTTSYAPWDIERVTGTYDSSTGSIGLTLRFHEPAPEGIAIDDYTAWVQRSCNGIVDGDVGITVDLEEVVHPRPAIPGLEPYAVSSVWVAGYEGDRVPFEITLSPDRREVAVAAVHSGLANRSYGCVSAGELGFGWAQRCDEYGCRPGGHSVTDQHGPFRLSGSGATPQLVPLSTHEARSYMREALRREFKEARRARGYRVTGCARSSETRVECTASWRTTRYRFRGPVTVWLTNDDGKVWWNYAFEIRRTESPCRRTPAARCARTFRVT